MGELATVNLGNLFNKCFCVGKWVPSSRVMMGAFPLIIPDDPVMKMKIEEKALGLMRNEK